jgi:hypothetical protein
MCTSKLARFAQWPPDIFKPLDTILFGSFSFSVGVQQKSIQKWSTNQAHQE